jgi:hypothetical protein
MFASKMQTGTKSKFAGNAKRCCKQAFFVFPRTCHSFVLFGVEQTDKLWRTFKNWESIMNRGLSRFAFLTPAAKRYRVHFSQLFLLFGRLF